VSAELSTAQKIAVGAGSAGIGGLLFGLLGLSGYAWLKMKEGTKMTLLEKTFASLVTQLLEHIEKLETEAEELRKRPSKASHDSLSGDNSQHIREIAGLREKNTSLNEAVKNRDREIESLSKLVNVNYFERAHDKKRRQR
jgi:hypothetical protein